jgi:hypothetical protein
MYFFIQVKVKRGKKIEDIIKDVIVKGQGVSKITVNVMR